MTTLAAGVLAALGAGALTLLVAGPIAAIAVLILAVAAVVGAMRLDAMYLRWAAGFFAAVLVVSIVVAVWATLTASNAVAGTSGPVDEPDPIALGAFDAQADVARTGSAFRLEVTEDQLSAGLQRSLADLADNPFSAISLDVLNPRREGAKGTIEFTAEFKDSGIEYTGEVALEIIDGKVHADVEHGKVGMLRVPCLVCGDYVDAIESAFNMDRILGGINGEYIALGVGANQVVLIGNHPSGGFVMPDALVTTINTEVLRTGLGNPPSETRPPGTVDGTEAPGDRYYVALGDSLSTGAGAEVTDGLASRLHRELSEQDGTDYGFRNFAKAGETSAGMIRNGQLDAALDFMRATDVAYVTVTLGSAELFDHLTSPDCTNGIGGDNCQQRLVNTFAAFRANLEQIAGGIASAAPNAGVVLVAPYNPFSLGLPGLAYDEAAGAVITEFALQVKRVADLNGFAFSNPQSSLVSTMGVATHILDDPPTWYPNEGGYSVLTGAVLQALAAAG